LRMPKDVIAQLMKTADERMLQAVEALKREFSMIRTGRANPAVLDRVLVEYYGQKVPVKQVGTISAPEPRMLLIAAWDKTMVKPIIDAITSSELGLNPNADGNMIRVPLPHLTTERRQELSKMAAHRAEEFRVEVRNFRREVLEKLRAMEKDGDITKDDLRRYQEQVQKVTEAHIEQIDLLTKAKEKEIAEG
jgi:ribosome recycling factor